MSTVQKKKKVQNFDPRVLGRHNGVRKNSFSFNFLPNSRKSKVNFNNKNSHFSFLFISFFFLFLPFLTTTTYRQPVVGFDPSISYFISHSLYFPFFFSFIHYLSFSFHFLTTQTLFFLTLFNINYILSLKKMCKFLPKIISTF